MKLIFLLLLLALVLNSVVRGQDIIYKTDGSEIRTKIIEIDENVVKYKNFDQQDGPLRSLDKTKIFLIIYENGKREKFEMTPRQVPSEASGDVPKVQPAEATKEPINDKQRTDQIRKDYLDLKIEQAKTTVKVGKGMFYGGWVGIGAGFLTAILSKNAADAGIITMIVSGVVMNVGVVVWIAGSAAKKGYENSRYEISLNVSSSPFILANDKITNYPQIGLKVRF